MPNAGVQITYQPLLSEGQESQAYKGVTCMLRWCQGQR